MRDTHPTLWHFYLLYALLSMGLGLNFIFLTPAFMPLGIDKLVAGLAFCMCGLVKVGLLAGNAPNNLARLSMTVSVFLYGFWAAASTHDFFALDQTSLQQPILYVGLAAVAVRLLLSTTAATALPITSPTEGVEDDN